MFGVGMPFAHLFFSTTPLDIFNDVHLHLTFLHFKGSV